MGTRGYCVYRYRAKYVATYNHYDSYPENFGVQMVNTIPRGQSVYKKWLEKMRGLFERLFRRAGVVEEECDDGDDERYHDDDLDIEEVKISEERRYPDMLIEYVYEIDLDDEVFWVNGMPIFRLDRMPTAEVFLEVLGKDSYGHFATTESVPSRHGYRIAAPPQPLSADMASYESLRGSTSVGTDIYELLSVAEEPSPDERVCIRLYEVIAGVLMCSRKFVSPLLASQITPLAPSTIPPYIVSTAKSLVFRAFLPMVFHPDVALSSEEWIEEQGDGDGAEMLWLKPDVCFSAGFYLEHDEHLRAAVGRMVRSIQQSYKPGIIYGIICSVFHCVIVRVELGSFQHTPALRFLPSRFADSPSTPGITALLRLAYAPRYNDALSEIVLSKWQFKPRLDAPQATYMDRLPPELIARIASFIPDLKTLLAFASLNPTTAAQAGSELRFPFIGDYHLLQVKTHDDLTQAMFVGRNGWGRTTTLCVQGMGPDDTMYDTQQRFGSECYSVFTHIEDARDAAYVLQAEQSRY